MPKMTLSYDEVYIEGKRYNVLDYPREEVDRKGPHILRKGTAYRIITDLNRGLFPYRGIIERGNKLDRGKSKPGIYFIEHKNEKYSMHLVYPHTDEEREQYSLGREHTVDMAHLDEIFRPEELVDYSLTGNEAGKSFKPPITITDDPLNTLMKLGIRLKDAPFDPYGKRLEALAIDKTGIEGINARNNAKRALITNTAMSPSKFITYADTWEMEAAFILKDIDGAANPMLPPGKMLVIFPSGPAFEIAQENLIEINQMVNDAINETESEQEKCNIKKPRKTKKQKKEAENDDNEH